MYKSATAFIVNPKAGVSNKKSLLKSLQDIGQQHKDWHIFQTMYAGHASEIASDFAEKGFGKIIAVGGDGTVNEVARALLHTKVAMGIIPSGSGNGLARHLGIPQNLNKAISIIEKGRSIEMDAGVVNNSHYFFCTAGVGFDAQVGKLFAAAQRRGVLTYLKTILEEYFTYKPQFYRIDVDGRCLELKALLITMANASQWGNNAVIAPHANTTDGLLDITIMYPFNPIEAAAVGLALITNNIEVTGHTEFIKGSNIRIERMNPGVVHCDGEPVEMSSTLEIKVLHKALTILS